MKNQKPKHGGPRQGSGRPNAGTVQLTVRPKVETVERMRERAKREQVTLGELIDAAF